MKTREEGEMTQNETIISRDEILASLIEANEMADFDGNQSETGNLHQLSHLCAVSQKLR